MFKNTICKVGKGIKKFVDKKIQAVKDIITDDKNRLILALFMIGSGAGLLVSVYVKVPN